MSKITRRMAIRTALEARYGPHSEKLIDALERIAFGKGVEVDSDIPGVVRRVTPTVAEMHAAIMDLLAYQHGRPRQGIDVEVDDKRQRWNPDRLTLTELEQLERLTKKAAGEVVEGVFTALPEGVKQ